jgi:hypothetical protein
MSLKLALFAYPFAELLDLHRGRADCRPQDNERPDQTCAPSGSRPIARGTNSNAPAPQNGARSGAVRRAV